MHNCTDTDLFNFQRYELWKPDIKCLKKKTKQIIMPSNEELRRKNSEKTHVTAGGNFINIHIFCYTVSMLSARFNWNIYIHINKRRARRIFYASLLLSNSTIHLHISNETLNLVKPIIIINKNEPFLSSNRWNFQSIIRKGWASIESLSLDTDEI